MQKRIDSKLAAVWLLSAYAVVWVWFGIVRLVIWLFYG